jgi:hypothetical protein
MNIRAHRSQRQNAVAPRRGVLHHLPTAGNSYRAGPLGLSRDGEREERETDEWHGRSAQIPVHPDSRRCGSMGWW